VRLARAGCRQLPPGFSIGPPGIPLGKMGFQSYKQAFFETVNQSFTN
jgi:hypothetical protein